jgi:hypothetical protein
VQENKSWKTKISPRNNWLETFCSPHIEVFSTSAEEVGTRLHKSSRSNASLSGEKRSLGNYKVFRTNLIIEFYNFATTSGFTLSVYRDIIQRPCPPCVHCRSCNVGKSPPFHPAFLNIGVCLSKTCPKVLITTLFILVKRWKLKSQNPFQEQ